jgi:hypothetical protein
LLDRLAISLEQYSQIEVPETAAVDMSVPGEEAMSRGGEAESPVSQPPTTPQPEPPAAATDAAAQPGQEDRHVADGQ